MRIFFYIVTFILPNIALANFEFSYVEYEVSYIDGKYIGLAATFYDVTSDALVEPKQKFTIGFDGDMSIGYFKSTRLDSYYI